MVRMKHNLNKTYLGLGSLVLASAIGSTALAQSAVVDSADIEIEAQFRRVLTLTAPANLDFTTGADNLIDFTSAVDNTDFVRLATDNSISFNATSDFTGAPTGDAGQVTVNGEPGEGIAIRCTATTTMALTTDSLETLPVSAIVIDVGVGGANWAGSDLTCAGLTTGDASLAHTLPGGGSTDIHIGAQIDGDTGMVGGTYSTNTAGGTHLTVRVQYP